MSAKPAPKGRVRRTSGEKWRANVEQLRERNEVRLLKTMRDERLATLLKAGEEDLLGPRFVNG